MCQVRRIRYVAPFYYEGLGKLGTLLLHHYYCTIIVAPLLLHHYCCAIIVPNVYGHRVILCAAAL